MSGFEFFCVAVVLGVTVASSAGGRQIPDRRRTYPRFFPGIRRQILFGTYAGVERFAVDELQRTVQLPFPYVVDVEPAQAVKPEEGEHLVLVGTAKDNPLIGELVGRGLLKAPEAAESYSIACFDSPWRKGMRVIALAGADPAGVLYAVEEFNSQIVPRALTPEEFDGIEDFAARGAPAIQNRGIWTWAYVVYDYKRFFDHMARLKMNTIIMWNDVVPQNCREVVDYAHSRGVKVILGFHWGYGVEGLDPTSAKQRKQIKAEVLSTFRREYRGLGMDGIYFQTFTENDNLTVGGKSTAALACEWVNDIAQAIFKLSPHIRVEFGLHGTSIRDNYVDLKPLDPRVTITWEDAGTLPYTYDPVAPDPRDAESTDPYRSFAACVEHSKKLVNFRSNREFSMVAKGWIQLPWRTSEHHGPYIQGERDPGFITSRLRQRTDRWDFVNALWMNNYPLAAKFYREILSCSPARCSVTGLIDDGMFEERIQPSVALFGETLWNPFLSDEDLLRRAQSPYYAK